MCFRKKLILRFILIFFILVPSIFTDSLITDDLSGTTYYEVHNYSISNDADKLTDLHNTDDNENIDNITYKLFSLCMTDTFNSSETFKISQFINRSQNQSGGFRFSFLFVPFFMLSGYTKIYLEYLCIMAEHLCKLIITYIHKSDGKKRLIFC